MKVLLACLMLAAAASSAACRGEDTPPPAETARPPQAEMPADPYQSEITRFQQQREAALTADTGWLTIGGLWFLTKPETTFGSDALNDIVLPGAAPGHAGAFYLRSGKVSVKAADGVTFELDGRRVTDAELRPDGEGTPDRISLGDIQLWVHNSGDRLSIRMRDRNNRLRKEFVGTSWFPIDPAYRVEASYTPYDKPKIVEVPNILGDIDRMPIPGIVSFTLDGREYKLEPVAEPGDQQFWFIFRDLTSQKETYPAARFLYAPAPEGGRMILDFNRAVNPPCAYNPYTTCPLPTEQNRLRTRIEAGEMKYKGHV
jgi:uncharacterized protein (DUF1684 family)